MKANRLRFLFILSLLVCSIIVNAQTNSSNKERAYQKFKQEIEQRKKHRDEMLLKARAEQDKARASVDASKSSTQQQGVVNNAGKKEDTDQN